MKKIPVYVNPYDQVHFGPSTVMTLHRFGIFDPDVARRVPTLSPFSAKLTRPSFLRPERSSNEQSSLGSSAHCFASNGGRIEPEDDYTSECCASFTAIGERS